MKHQWNTSFAPINLKDKEEGDNEDIYTGVGVDIDWYSLFWRKISPCLSRFNIYILLFDNLF